MTNKNQSNSCPPHYWIIDSENMGKCRWCPKTKDFAKLQAKENFTKRIIFGFIPDFLEESRTDADRVYAMPIRMRHPVYYRD